MSNLVLSYKYRIGDYFYDRKNKRIITITGHNTFLLDNVYKGKITTYIGKSSATFESNYIYEDTLHDLERYSSLTKLINNISNKEEKKMDGKDKTTSYKIFYFDNPKTGGSIENTTVNLTSIRKLAKLLNLMKKRNPDRRITMVTIVDENGKYVDYVRFLNKEIAEQKWLTGYKERLLAYAKHHRGYEVATNF